MAVAEPELRSELEAALKQRDTLKSELQTAKSRAGAHAHAHAHAQAPTHMRKHAHAQARTHAHTHTYTHEHEHTHAQARSSMQIGHRSPLTPHRSHLTPHRSPHTPHRSRFGCTRRAVKRITVQMERITELEKLVAAGAAHAANGEAGAGGTPGSTLDTTFDRAAAFKETCAGLEGSLEVAHSSAAR